MVYLQSTGNKKCLSFEVEEPATVADFLIPYNRGSRPQSLGHRDINVMMTWVFTGNNAVANYDEIVMDEEHVISIPYGNKAFIGALSPVEKSDAKFLPGSEALMFNLYMKGPALWYHGGWNYLWQTPWMDTGQPPLRCSHFLWDESLAVAKAYWDDILTFVTSSGYKTTYQNYMGAGGVTYTERGHVSRDHVWACEIDSWWNKITIFRYCRPFFYIYTDDYYGAAQDEFWGCFMSPTGTYILTLVYLDVPAKWVYRLYGP